MTDKPSSTKADAYWARAEEEHGARTLALGTQELSVDQFGNVPLHTAGKHPADERIAVFTRKAERGETGKPLVQVYGRTDYNYNIDRLSLEREK